MESSLLYFACVVGAAALYVVLRPGRRAARGAAAVAGLGVFAWLLVQAGGLLASVSGLRPAPGEANAWPDPFFLLFSLIAVASATRMITHHRPVYSALYFVMVVLSSAGLFLMLDAEFMAFALVIVYAGAILITYMFVLMLAQQAPDFEHKGAQPDYDRVAREPAAAAVVGFLMLAVFTHMTYAGVGELPPPKSAAEGRAAMWQRLDLMPRELADIVHELDPDAQLAPSARVQVVDGVARVEVTRPGGVQPVMLALPASALPNNVQLVGLDLVAKFPVSLELAGIILLMAMFGAAVLARRQIELVEDEVREAAGLKRLDLHGDEGEPAAPTAQFTAETQRAQRTQRSD